MEKANISAEYTSLLRKADDFIKDKVVEIFGENNDNIPLAEEVTFCEAVGDYEADLVTIDKMSTVKGNLLVHIKERDCGTDKIECTEWQEFIYLDDTTRIEIVNNIKF